MVNSIKKKKAIAMIELIFALVIMGIVLMSAPMLIQQSVRSGNVALQQEAISLTAEKISWILSMPWDEHKDIIKINNITPKGLPPQTSRSISDKNASLISSFGTVDANDSTFDDIDDFHGDNNGLVLFGSATSSDVGDYVDNNVSINTTISYADINLSNINLNGKIYNNKNMLSPTHIKFIKVNLTPNRNNISELEKNITMEAFSCNIGTYDIIGKKL